MNNLMTLCAPCLFGLEGVAAAELKRLGMKNIRTLDGRVLFDGGLDDAATACVSLRTAERVQIVAGAFKAATFDELFEATRAITWEEYIPRDGAFPVRGHCVSSKLMSVPDCRSIIKKAVASRLGSHFGAEQMPEDGARFQLRFTILRDEVLLHIDMTGDALHKRGYRALSAGAPIRETLAAGMVMLAGYRGRGALRDPFCGSGTIPIEAALIARNIAPGLRRSFAMEAWEGGAAAVARAKETARAAEFHGSYDITASDIDAESVELARRNAALAGVGEIVRFSVVDVHSFTADAPRGVIVTNPPYGERLGDAAAAAELMCALGEAVARAEGWQTAVISSDAETEKHFGKKADKKRKLYNGMLRCDLFMFGY